MPRLLYRESKGTFVPPRSRVAARLKSFANDVARSLAVPEKEADRSVKILQLTFCQLLARRCRAMARK